RDKGARHVKQFGQPTDSHARIIGDQHHHNELRIGQTDIICKVLAVALHQVEQADEAEYQSAELAVRTVLYERFERGAQRWKCLAGGRYSTNPVACDRSWHAHGWLI